MDRSPYLAAAIQAMSQPPPTAPSYGPTPAQLMAMAQRDMPQHTPGNGVGGLFDALRNGNLGIGARAQAMGDPQQLPQAATPPDLSGLMKIGQQAPLPPY